MSRSSSPEQVWPVPAKVIAAARGGLVWGGDWTGEEGFVQRRNVWVQDSRRRKAGAQS